MFELFLFIDPLCKKCMKAENVVTNISNDLEYKFKFQFIPILNLKIISKTLKKMEKYDNNITINDVHNLYYQILLDYKAALFQGMKRGRTFLMYLQEELLFNNRTYSNNLVFSIAEKAKIDLEMFKEDRISELAKKEIRKDQILVNQMNIKSPDSAVLFDCKKINSDGILLKDINYSILFKTCCREKIFDTKKYNNFCKLHVIK
ncbi:DsbA family protein [Apilactobacillus sp. TMW 2.2459]|uniref:DsbA family protein n=1 Tax=Apilactobacillus xinyiensis TaxID=2841032 RepID=UPI001C7DB0DE|nr:DsbA family protein [Apilactobacillus xinyiensis]MCL0312432.1 DsbA family protein [Apilactobacillus xinyiensis]